MHQMNTLECLYLALHNALYRYRVRHQSSFSDKYIISIGNLSTGGTGKTPTAIFLARRLIHQKPIVILRGYRGSRSRKGILVSDGNAIHANCAEVGDEALLISRIKGLKVAVGPSRSSLIEKYGKDCKVVLLDDAFQNPAVFRNHELVLIDAIQSSGSRKILPMGLFREPMAALSRANSVLLTRVDQVAEEVKEGLKREISRYLPKKMIFESIHKIDVLEPILRPEEAGPVGLFCGIGNSTAFIQTVISAGYDIKEKLIFPDHHFYSSSDLERISHLGRKYGLSWITTEKDAVRFENKQQFFPGFYKKMHVLKIRLQVLDGREKEFLAAILGTSIDSSKTNVDQL